MAWLALIIAGAAALDTPHMADVSFYDDSGSFQSYQLSYFLRPDALDTGVTFDVDVHSVALLGCLPQLDDIDDEYFAVYVLVPAECPLAELIAEIESYGADFIFLDAAQTAVGPADAFNTYDEPVFFLDARVTANLFQLSADVGQRAISVRLRDEESEAGAAQLQFFYEAGFPHLAAYLAVLRDVWTQLGERVAFEPVLVTFSSTQRETVAAHCVAGGEHCAAPSAGADGRAVLAESLRQSCAGRASTRQYFDYMNFFLRACADRFDEQCSALCQQRAGLAGVAGCVEQSFGPGDAATRTNAALTAYRRRFKALGLRQFPAIVINNTVYRGTLSKFDLLLSLCTALDDDSEQCRSLALEAGVDIDLPGVLLVALLSFGLAVLLMSWLCRRLARERYMAALNGAISKHVAEYAAEEATNM